MSAAPPLVALIAAVARNRAIGRGNQLLWSEPADQRHFRQATLGCPVVMGRRTWESLPPRFRPLPGRRNVVVTRNAAYAAPGAETAPDLDTALARVVHPAADPSLGATAAGDTAAGGAGGNTAARVFVIGGGELYTLALPRADELWLTEIDADLDGDTFFPPFDPSAFQEVDRQTQQAADGTRFAFVTYRRRSLPWPPGTD